MMPNTKRYLKRPTAVMVEVLMECHEREIMKLPPCDASVPFSTGLLARNLVKAGDFINEKGKKYVALYITESGKRFLDNITKQV